MFKFFNDIWAEIYSQYQIWRLGGISVPEVISPCELARGWRLFRIFRAIPFLAMLLIITSGLLSEQLKKNIFTFYIMAAVVIISIILFLIGVTWTSLWRCPKCANSYSWNSRTGNLPFNSKCKHCGLELGSLEINQDDSTADDVNIVT